MNSNFYFASTSVVSRSFKTLISVRARWVQKSHMLAAFCMVLWALTACSPGTGGSKVGEQQPVSPTAIVTKVGTGTDVRSGSEVLFSGKDSFGGDGPILSYAWTQTDSSGVPLQLVVRNSNTVSFTAPDVSAATTFTLQLLVTDDTQKTATANVSVNVLPFGDANLFLAALAVPTTFKVTAATVAEIAPSAMDTPFEVSVQQVVTYPGRDGATQTYTGPTTTQSGAWLGTDGSGGPSASAYNNPTLVFNLPALDVDDVNMAHQNAAPGSSGRNRILDLDRVDLAVVNVIVTLTSATDPLNTFLYVLSDDGAVLASQASDGSGAPAVAMVALQDLLRASGQETAATATAYYTAIDPSNERTTLNDWLTINCFNPTTVDYSADVHTVYTNDFDLGFGRDMYVNSDCASVGDVASVVVNYASMEAAAKKIDPIIAVAMEYTGPVNGDPDDRFTKFYVYAPDDVGDFVRVLTANFDGRGEKYTPGTCTACHGGQVQALDASGAYLDNGKLGAIFMPWDLDSFLYSDSDPAFLNTPANSALHAQYTRAAQESQFKAQNQIVLNTYQSTWPITGVVEGWYGGAGLPASTFDGSYTPDGWIPASSGGPAGNPDDAESLYHQVIAQNCRACHTQSDDQVRPVFATYAEFIDAADLHTLRIYDQGSMPLARRTMDQFWVSTLSPSPAAVLRTHLGLSDERQVGAPVANIGGFEMQSSVNLMPFSLDGSDSNFAQTFNWTFVTRPDGSTAQMIGANSPQPSFFIDQSGSYEIQLEVSNAHQQSDTATVVIVASSVVPVAANNARLDVAEGGNANLSAAVLSYTDPDTGDSNLIYTVTTPPVRGFLSMMQFTQQDLVDASVSYTHDGSETSTDSFFFTLSDGTTNLEGQSFNFTVIPGNDAPTPALNEGITVAEGGSGVISGNQLAFTDVDNTVNELVYTVTTAPVNGMLSVNTFTQADLDAATLVNYTHDGTETMQDSFVLSVSDGQIEVPGITVLVTVTQVNDSPVVTSNAGLTLMEGTTAVIGQALLETKDNDNTPSELVYAITSAPVNGLLSVTNFTQEDINAGIFSYAHDGSETTSDVFEFSVTDGITSTAGMFALIVQPVSDAPTVMANSPLDVNINEANVAITSAFLTYDDIDNTADELIYTVTTPPAQGSLSANTFSQAQINAGNVQYTHIGDESSPGQLTFDFTVTDGLTTVSNTFTFNIVVSFDTNVLPILASATCATAGCHGQPASGVRPDYSGSASSVFSQLVPTRTDFTTDRNGDTLINAMDALILCVPSDECQASNNTDHDPINAISGVTSPDYLMLLRWLDEGLDAPGN